MRNRSDSELRLLPTCPGCKGRHLPAWTEKGPRWCDGIPARAYGPVVTVQPVPDFLPEEL